MRSGGCGLWPPLPSLKVSQQLLKEEDVTPWPPEPQPVRPDAQ